MTGSEPESPTAAMLDGRYRLLECVGKGGMSRVHRAEDTALGRIVAIKLMADMGDEDAARARGEVAVLASLSHPALVTLFDAHIGAGQDYLVMEFVDGPTLSQLLREGPLPAAETAALATELAEALHAVHRAGIVHRDVKPSNVLLASTDVPGRRFHAKLADFGIAYLLSSDRMTSPGMVMGTAAYLAPEQARGATPTPATDVYALGLILLEALTGEPAFPRTTPVASAVVRQTTRPEIPASVPAGWASLIERMTAPDPADRPSAGEVASETARLANAPRAPHDADATMPLAAAGLGAAAGAGVPGAAAAGAGVAAAAAAADAPTAAIPATGAMPATEAMPASAAMPATAGMPASAGAAPAAAGAAAAAPRRNRRRPALIATGAAAAAAAIGLGAWALSNVDTATEDPSRGVAPVVQTESPETTSPPSQQPAEVPVPATDDDGTTEEDQRKAEEEQRKAEEEQRKAEEDKRKAEEKAAEEQRKAEEKAAEEQRKAEEKAAEEAEEQAEEDAEEQPLPSEEPAPPPVTEQPPATEAPAS
ncbi:serine/threonine-protein kinase [Microbacterium sp. JZ31]|uniref:serine/threonine-protein kinase n=1 Tax=Microbacterium sp. JZ31 TaxID=1906274 RepID=UPI001EE4A24E|nr:serine/threonine-protein kinase [Microbacterium sp. JZ31]